MKGWLITLLVLAVIAAVKVGVHICYENKEFSLALQISKFRLNLIGKDKTEKRKNDRKKKTAKEKTIKKTEPKEKAPKKKGKLLENPWIRAVLDYWQQILELIGRVLRTPTLDILRLQLWVGGGDSEKCAMTYGRVCAVLGAVLPVVENTFGIRKRQIDVWCCYDRDSIDAAVETAITVRVYEVFVLVFALLGLGIKIFLQARNYKKAVQKL